MLKVKLEVCANGRPALAKVLEHLRLQHSDWLEIIEQDLQCADPGDAALVRLDGTVILVPEDQVPAFAERVVQAVSRRVRRCTRCRARVCSGICAPN